MNELERALELIESDKWDEAHQLVQGGKSRYFYLIHGLLHRIEGDLSNAGYWYNKAGEDLLENTLEEELSRIRSLISK